MTADAQRSPLTTALTAARRAMDVAFKASLVPSEMYVSPVTTRPTASMSEGVEPGGSSFTRCSASLRDFRYEWLCTRTGR